MNLEESLMDLDFLKNSIEINFEKVKQILGVAIRDIDPKKREEAFDYIVKWSFMFKDQSNLISLVEESLDSKIRYKALELIDSNNHQPLLKDVVKKDLDYLVRKKAVELIDDQTLLIDVIRTDPDELVAISAMDKINFSTDIALAEDVIHCNLNFKPEFRHKMNAAVALKDYDFLFKLFKSNHFKCHLVKELSFEIFSELFLRVPSYSYFLFQKEMGNLSHKYLDFGSFGENIISLYFKENHLKFKLLEYMVDPHRYPRKYCDMKDTDILKQIDLSQPFYQHLAKFFYFKKCSYLELYKSVSSFLTFDEISILLKKRGYYPEYSYKSDFVLRILPEIYMEILNDLATRLENLDQNEELNIDDKRSLMKIFKNLQELLVTPESEYHRNTNYFKGKYGYKIAVDVYKERMAAVCEIITKLIYRN